MMAHQPRHALIVVLLTCAACEGNTTTTAADGTMTACHQCINGYQAVALPAEKALACYGPTPEHTYQLLRALAEEAAPARHPLVYNVTQVPYHLQRPLLNNVSDRPKKPGPDLHSSDQPSRP